MSNQKPIILAITGASGSIYGIKLLEFLLANDYSVELIISDNAIKVIQVELGWNLDSSSSRKLKSSILSFLNLDYKKVFLNLWGLDNIAAAVSSGSYKTQGMIIAPCSMGTLANINAGTSNNLIARAADVCIKEKRRVVLVARETPLSSIHLRNMYELSQAGVTVLPAAPGFYHKPESIDELVNQIIGKTLDQFEIDNELFKRWTQSRNPLKLIHAQGSKQNS